MVRKRVLTRFLSGLGALLLLAGITVQVFLPGKAFATPLTSISVTLAQGTKTTDVNADGIPDGGTMPSGSANYTFKFDPSSTSVNAIVFEFCTTEQIPSAGLTTCTAPTGMYAYNVTNNGNGTTSNLAVGNDDGTGFTIDTADSTNNQVVLTGTAGALPTTSGAATFTVSNIINPSTANTTFYAYIATYSSYAAGSGTLVDDGSGAFSTASPIQLQGTMPETLVFCDGHYIPINGSGVPDCTQAKEEVIDFNQLFDPNTPAWAYSQMAAATNANSGYAITVNGPTMSDAGSYPITAMNTTDISRPGTSQFGMNLIDDFQPTTDGYLEPDHATNIAPDPYIGTGGTNPITYYNADGQTTGGQINPASDGTNYFGIQDGYNAAGQTNSYNGQWPDGTNNTGDTSNYPTFTFKSGDIVASSDWTNSGGYVHESGTDGPTDTQRYTSTYIVNVPGNQPAGTYTTTLTYICTPTF